MRLPHGLRALRHRDFRFFLAGKGLAQTGLWLQNIATSWLVYKLTGSTLMLGLASFAMYVPITVLAPVAAVWVDRMPKRRVLVYAQSLGLVQALVMFALVATGHIQAWHLIAANAVIGVVNAFDGPARQSMIIELVGGREDLPNAIALSSALMNSARFIGPLIGGAVIAGFGEVWGFGLNALLYCAVLYALWTIRPVARVPEASTASWFRQLQDGFSWAFGFLPTRSILLLVAMLSLTTSPYQALAPWFAKEVFHGDSGTLGMLVGAGGFGAVSGVLYLASRPTVRGLLTLAPAAAAASSLALISFTFTHTLWLGLVCIYFIAMGMMITATCTNTVLQTIVEDRLRARVAAIYMLSFLGVTPLGALGAGWAAERIGAPLTLAIGGGCGLVAAALYWLKLPEIRKAIRPVYEKLGIITDNPRP
jgi:MFS family permease